MKEEQLTTDTALRTIDRTQNTTFWSFWSVFFQRLHPVKCQMSNVKCSQSRGFSLVEMIVALGIFTIVLFMATSAFLAVVNADRKSRATRIAMDNLNLALEDMSRRIKTGSNYNCGNDISQTTKDCSSGGESLKFIDQDGQSFVYKRGVGSSGCANNNLYADGQGCILRNLPNDTTFMLATSPEIDIKSLKFIVSGSSPSDTVQPVVFAMIEGSLGASTMKTLFNIQTTITQRKYDAAP